MIVDKDVTFHCNEQFSLGQKAKKLINEEKTEEDGPLEFKSTKFKYNFVPGSRSSIEFHEALDQTEAKDVFKSETI